jgi:hypothetical protein
LPRRAFARPPPADFRDEADREREERARDGLEGLPPGCGRALTAFLAMSATAPAAVVTTDPTVLAAVPTPDVTVPRTVLLSSAIVPP